MTASQSLLRARLAASTLTDLGDDFYEVLFFALGSKCQFLFIAPDPRAAEAFVSAAFDWLSAYEARFSRFLPDSLLSRINAQAGVDWVEIDPQAEQLLELCGRCHFITEGAFDPTALPLSLLWDWKRKHEALPRAEEIAGALSLVGWKRLQRAPGRVFLPQKGMMLDFGGVGKELAVDCVKTLAQRVGLERVLVDLGGDIAVLGDAPEGDGWSVGLEDPQHPGETWCQLRLHSGAAVATSGDYRRCFELAGRSFGHILDCRTGWPVSHGTRAATVIAPNCTVAGLMSTAAIVLGGLPGIRLIERSAGLQGCLWHQGQLYETRDFRRTVLPRQMLPH